jgi:hypothetical protein
VLTELADARIDRARDDHRAGREILEASFERVELETVGSMVIFAATNPRTKPSTGMMH